MTLQFAPTSRRHSIGTVVGVVLGTVGVNVILDGASLTEAIALGVAAGLGGLAVVAILHR